MATLETVRLLRSAIRGLDPRLPRAVWILQGGGLANAFGNGVVLPFLIIYLHNVRGISLGVAGLVAAANSAAALASGFLAGSLADRVGPRAVLVGALCVMTVAISLFPLIREVWHAFALNALLGAGSGAFWPSQSSLLTGLASSAQRHAAFAVQRVTMNLGAALGGLAGGLIASASSPETFTALFLLDAATFLAYVAVLVRLPTPRSATPVVAGGYGDVLRNRSFVGYTLLNAAFMAAGVAAVVELLPPFAKNEAGVSETGIGLIFFVNCVVVVVAQLPVTKLAEGRRRMRGFALMGLIWATSLLGVAAAGLWLDATAATALIVAALALFAFGECLHGTIHGPLSADLAPPPLVGRYMALASQSWQIGWIVGPAAGGFLLQHAPNALWLIAAAVNLAGAACSLALERGLPRDVRRTPVGTEPALTPLEA